MQDALNATVPAMDRSCRGGLAAGGSAPADAQCTAAIALASTPADRPAGGHPDRGKWGRGPFAGTVIPLDANRGAGLARWINATKSAS